MNVKNTEKAAGKATIVIEVEKAEFDAALTKAYNKARKDIFVPGFRKGKAPRKVVEGMYGAKVFYEDAVNEIYPDLYEKAIVEQAIKAVGTAYISKLDDGEDGGVVLTMETDLYPEVTLGDYKGLEVPKADVNVTDEEVEAEIDRMAERNSRIETVDRPAQEGDTVVLDFEGFDNGVPFEGGKGEKYSLKLGSHQFVPGFEEALVGVSAGEEKDVNVTFPENYTPELAGKPVVFKCKIHEVKETILPEKDDEFAKDVSEFDTLDALRADIRTKRENERSEAVERAFESAVVEKAAANMTCDIPASMIEEQLDKHLEQFAYQLQMNGMKLDDYAKMMGGDMSSLRASMRPMAETTVRNNVLLDAVAAAENITVSDEEVNDEIKKLAEQYSMEEDKVRAAVGEESLKTDLAAKKAMKLLVESAVATEMPKAEEKEASKEEE